MTTRNAQLIASSYRNKTNPNGADMCNASHIEREKIPSHIFASPLIQSHASMTHSHMHAIITFKCTTIQCRNVNETDNWVGEKINTTNKSNIFSTRIEFILLFCCIIVDRMACGESDEYAIEYMEFTNDPATPSHNITCHQNTIYTMMGTFSVLNQQRITTTATNHESQ